MLPLHVASLVNVSSRLSLLNPSHCLAGRTGAHRAGGRARGAEGLLLHFVFSSFSSSVSLREAFTLLDTSCPWEKRRWRSLKVRFSGAPAPPGTPASWLLDSFSLGSQ